MSQVLTMKKIPGVSALELNLAFQFEPSIGHNDFDPPVVTFIEK